MREHRNMSIFFWGEKRQQQRDMKSQSHEGVSVFTSDIRQPPADFVTSSAICCGLNSSSAFHPFPTSPEKWKSLNTGKNWPTPQVTSHRLLSFEQRQAKPSPYRLPFTSFYCLIPHPTSSTMMMLMIPRKNPLFAFFLIFTFLFCTQTIEWIIWNWGASMVIWWCRSGVGREGW